MPDTNRDISIIKETRLYSEAVTLTGYGKFNIYVLLVTGGCLMCVIIETMCMAFIVPAAQCDLNLSLTEKGVLTSISFLGVISTSHLWGFLADVRGRKNVLICCLLISSLFSSISSIVPWTWLFILLRFFNGAAIGGASSILYVFAGEFHDDRFRPMVISWISAFYATGQAYIPGMAWIILSNDWSFYIGALGINFRPWRLLLIIYAMPSLIVAAMLSILPESPKFLLAQGNHDYTLQILTKMFVVNTGKKSHEYPVSTITLDELIVKKTENKPNMLKFLWKQMYLLFNREYLVKTILTCYLQFGVFFSASALTLWFPEILNNLSRYAQETTNTHVTLCDSMQNTSMSINLKKLFYHNILWTKNDGNTRAMNDSFCNDSVDTGVFPVVLIMGLVIGFACIIIGILINKIGKKILIIGTSAIAAICGLAAQYVSGYETILVLCGIFLLIFALIGVINALVVDLYPTHIRAMALAVSLMFGRLGAMVGSNIVGLVFYNYCQYIFVLFAINHLIIIVATVLLPTKTIQVKNN